MFTSKLEIVLIQCSKWLAQSRIICQVLHYSTVEAQVLKGHVPRLPAMNGARPPNAGLFTDSDVARQFVTELADAVHSLVVLMHSYGGQVGTM